MLQPNQYKGQVKTDNRRQFFFLFPYTLIQAILFSVIISASWAVTWTRPHVTTAVTEMVSVPEASMSKKNVETSLGLRRLQMVTALYGA